MSHSPSYVRVILHVTANLCHLKHHSDPLVLGECSFPSADATWCQVRYLALLLMKQMMFGHIRDPGKVIYSIQGTRAG